MGPAGTPLSESRYVMAYQGRFHFDAPPSTVWAAMDDVDQFERWGGWLGRITIDEVGLRTGTVMQGTVSPPLPYRMEIRVELASCVPAARVDAVVSGDLKGVATLTLEPAGQGTDMAVAWTIEMMQRPMRVAARFAYPLLRWGHDRVVEATVRGFRLRVDEIHGQRNE